MKKLMFLLLLSNVPVLAMNLQTPPLLAAVEQGDLARVRQWLVDGADVNGSDNAGYTALHEAAWRGNVAIMTELLNRGATVDVLSDRKNTPFRLAASKGHVAAMELLYQWHADINNRDEEGFTPLLYAVANARFEAAQWLIQHNADIHGQHLLVSAVGKPVDSDLDLVELLLANGAPVDEKDESGCTVLYHAARLGKTDVLDLFVQHGVDIEKKDSDNRTMLHTAVFMGNIGFVKVLLAHGADMFAEGYASDDYDTQVGKDGRIERPKVKKTITPYAFAERWKMNDHAMDAIVQIFDEHRKKRSKIKGIAI